MRFVSFYLKSDVEDPDIDPVLPFAQTSCPAPGAMILLRATCLRRMVEGRVRSRPSSGACWAGSKGGCDLPLTGVSSSCLFGIARVSLSVA